MPGILQIPCLKGTFSLLFAVEEPRPAQLSKTKDSSFSNDISCSLGFLDLLELLAYAIPRVGC